MHESVAAMLQSLTLRPESGAADTFVGTSIKMPHNRVFGGQVLAQTLIAASATVESSPPLNANRSNRLPPLTRLPLKSSASPMAKKP